MLSGAVRISTDWLYGYGDGVGGAGAFAGTAATALGEINNGAHHLAALFELDGLVGAVLVADGAILLVLPGHTFLPVDLREADGGIVLLLHGERAKRAGRADLRAFHAVLEAILFLIRIPAPQPHHRRWNS